MPMLPSDAFLSTRHIVARQISAEYAVRSRGPSGGIENRRRKRARLSRALNAATILFVPAFFLLLLLLAA